MSIVKMPRGLHAFAVLLAISLVVWFRPLLDTLALAKADDRYTQILLILPLSAALILQRWRREFVTQRWLPALSLLGISLPAAGLAHWGGLDATSGLSLAIAMAGLVLWWVGSFVSSFGLAAWRSLRFPLLFLLWMIPMPKPVLDPIVAVLQRGSTLAAQSLFWIFRVPVAREGTMLQIPGLDIDVTVECSSIRSSLMLLVTTMVVAYLLLKTPWRRLLVILLVVPLSIAKNGLRIFVIGMLGTRVDPSYLTGRLHRQGGIVFFLLALAMIFLFLWALRRGEQNRLDTQLA